MSNAHPNDAALRHFSRGELDEIVGTMIAVHLKHCKSCKDKVLALEESVAQDVMSINVPVSTRIDDETLDDIFSAAIFDSSQPEPQITQAQCKIDINGLEIELPENLKPLVDSMEPWSKILGGVWHSEIKGHGLGYKLDFIYMEAGGTIPEHTHNGKEITLVLDGCFGDENGQYLPGDFISKEGTDQHSPYSDKGCLCVALVDAPLHFTKGLARLVNPFSQLFFSTEADTPR